MDESRIKYSSNLNYDGKSFLKWAPGRGISAETCGLDGVFPPDDLGSGPCTPFIIYIPHIIAAFLVIKINSFWETYIYIPKVGVATLVYWMILYCYCFLSGFKRTFSCIIQYSL